MRCFLTYAELRQPSVGSTLKEKLGRRMRMMKSRFLAGMLLLWTLGFLAGCKTSSTSSSTTGFLFISNKGDNPPTLSSYTINLSNGGLTAIGTPLKTTTKAPVGEALAGTTLFVLDGPATTPSTAGTIFTYTVNADGTLTAGSSTAVVKNAATNHSVNSVALAVAPSGKFLFVANQGDFTNPSSGTVSVFSVSGSTLTEVPGSPFSTSAAGAATSAGPTALAVTPDSKFLYVADYFTAGVNGFQIDPASGGLTPVANSVNLPYAVKTGPAGLAVVPFVSGTTTRGGFLYVSNSGSNNVSAFAICNQDVTSCTNVNQPDGTLTEIPGSPFSAGLFPAAAAVDPLGQYLYVVDQQSNQISQYKIAAGTGAISALGTPAISTGSLPVSITIHPEISGGTLEFAYATNFNSDTVSVYQLDTTTGLLALLAQPVTVGGQPSAVATK
jgi:6-phosphogluconolactonase (cycloisomerase 2 family)